MNRYLVRSSDASTFFESFLVAAVSSFLAIRFFLAVTGYPQLGGNGLHIAHMLWGGLLMLVGILLLISYLDRGVHHIAAVIGGIGFGIFIDEIGKFLTSDNDYFFQPAVALIYVLFIVLFLVVRTLVGRHGLTPTESLANALDLVQSTIGRAIEPDDRTRIRRLLDAADPESPLVRDLGRYLDGLPRIPEVQSPIERIVSRLGHVYRRLVENDWFERGLVAFVIAYTVAAIVGVLAVTFAIGERETSTVVIAQAVSTGIGVALILRGGRPPDVTRRGLPLVHARAARLDPGQPGLRVLQLAAGGADRPGDRPGGLRHASLRHPARGRRRRGGGGPGAGRTLRGPGGLGSGQWTRKVWELVLDATTWPSVALRIRTLTV